MEEPHTSLDIMNPRQSMTISTKYIYKKVRGKFFIDHGRFSYNFLTIAISSQLGNLGQLIHSFHIL